MRRIGDLMKDLGFDKNGSVETQKAFIKHLIQAAQVSQIDRKSKKIETQSQPEQLSFNFEEPEAPPTNNDKKPKAVG